MKQVAVIIFTKSPRHGRVKTRLAPALGKKERAELSERLLFGTIEKLSAMNDADLFICFTPPSAFGYLVSMGSGLYIQEGRGMGERMRNALNRILKMGYGRAVMAGSDIPGLDADTVRRAFALLKDNDIVLGPSEDGGYYLVGVKDGVPDIFTGVRWSSGHTLKDTLKLAERLGLSVGTTKTLLDIDTPEDLRRAGLALSRKDPLPTSP